MVQDQRSRRILSYRDLEVWQKAMDLVVDTYKAVSLLPGHERFGLASQMCRAAVSVPANIAEGHGREHLGDYIRMLSIANGSLAELETEIMIASRLGYLPQQTTESTLTKTAETGRLLAGLIRALKRVRLAPPTPDT